MISLTLHEKKSHGTVSFPAEYYYIDSCNPRYQLPFHWHREWELIRVVRGSVLFTVNGEEYLAGQDDHLLIPEGFVHGGTPIAADSIYECLTFDLSGLFSGCSAELSRLMSPFIRLELQPKIFFRSGSGSAVDRTVRNAMSACADIYIRGNGNDGLKLMVISSIAYLFGLIYSEKLFSLRTEDASPLRRSEQIKAVLEYIEQNYRSAISLDTLASIAGLSPKYFCQVFREVTHRTPLDYVIFYRIEQSCILLTESDLSVSEISRQCGFNDSGYFTKQFRQMTGTTPLKYRRQYGKL